MKINRLHKHTIYILLATVLVAAIAIFKLADQPNLQAGILTGIVFIYLAWAIFYHHIDKSIRLEIIIEYVLTAALALTFMYGILL